MPEAEAMREEPICSILCVRTSSKIVSGKTAVVLSPQRYMFEQSDSFARRMVLKQPFYCRFRLHAPKYSHVGTHFLVHALNLSSACSLSTQNHKPQVGDKGHPFTPASADGANATLSTCAKRQPALASCSAATRRAWAS